MFCSDKVNRNHDKSPKEMFETLRWSYLCAAGEKQQTECWRQKGKQMVSGSHSAGLCPLLGPLPKKAEDLSEWDDPRIVEQKDVLAVSQGKSQIF